MTPIRGLSLDLPLAINRIKRDMRNDWFPDAIGFRDMVNPARFAKSIHEPGYAPQSAETFDLPKLGFTLRYSLETSFRDRVIYQAIIDTLIPHYDSLLAPIVFSHRFSKPESWYIFQPFIDQWLTFIRTIRTELGTGSRVLLTTDIQNYFEAINLQLLKSTLIERSDGSTKMRRTITALHSLLSKWSAFNGLGIPQNRDASSFLGNAFLLPVDEAMLGAGYRYFRYMDDIHIICDDVYQARRAIKELIGHLRKLHLNVNSKKTSIVAADSEEVDKTLPPPNGRLEKIDKYLKSGDVKEMKKALPLLHQYTKLLIANEHTSTRDFKACVNRLEKVARVRQLSFDFTGVADAVAHELMAQPWNSDLLVRYLEAVPVSESVVSLLVEILSDSQRNIYDWQSYHLWKVLGQIGDANTDLRRLARNSLRLDPSSAPMRAGAILYLGAHGSDRDRNRIAERAAVEDSRFVKRAILIATQEVSRRVREKYVQPEIPAEVGLPETLRGDDFGEPMYFAPTGTVVRRRRFYRPF
jgi:hypothetical protein